MKKILSVFVVMILVLLTGCSNESKNASTNNDSLESLLKTSLTACFKGDIESYSKTVLNKEDLERRCPNLVDKYGEVKDIEININQQKMTQDDIDSINHDVFEQELNSTDKLEEGYYVTGSFKIKASKKDLEGPINTSYAKVNGKWYLAY